MSKAPSSSGPTRGLADQLACLCSLFALPEKTKDSLPKADWATGQIIYGMEKNVMAGRHIWLQAESVLWCISMHKNI